MQTAVNHIYIIDVQADAAALQQVEEVGPGIGGNVPDGAGLDLDILRLLHALEDGDGVARNLKDARKLRQGTVKFALRLAQGGYIGHAPELLGLAQVGEDDEGDKAVGIGLAVDGTVVQVEGKLPGVPELGDHSVLFADFPAVKRGDFVGSKLVTRGDAVDAGDIIALPPGEDTVDIGGGDAHTLFEGVPGDLIAAVAQDGAIYFGGIVQLGAVIQIIDAVDKLLGLLRHIGFTFYQGLAGEIELVHQIAGDLIDGDPGVVEDELAVPGALGPLGAVVEIEVGLIGAEAAAIKLGKSCYIKIHFYPSLPMGRSSQ